MSGNYIGYIIDFLAVLLFVACWGVLIFRILKGRLSRVETVKAKVIDKYKEQNASTIPDIFKRERFVVVFLSKGKKRAFYVSEFSFDGYRINEEGILKYQGNRIIDFK